MFDVSVRGFRGPSLNDCLFPGPKLQQDIVDILTRFHVPKHVFTTDICKMYRQILVRPQYRKFQHILWRASPRDTLCEYGLRTVTYGINCAPFLALRVLQDIASNDCDDFDSVRAALQRQTYVDDICTGADTVVELLKLQSDLILVLKRAGVTTLISSPYFRLAWGIRPVSILSKNYYATYLGLRRGVGRPPPNRNV